MTETNAAIGSGFDERTGRFSGDSRSASTPKDSGSELGSDHPFHNVDQSTMLAMKKALVVLQKVKGDNSVHQIADRLYLGSIGAALNLPELQSVGITHILCTATGVRSMHPDKFVYKTLTVLDSHSESLIDHFADSIYWIECVLRENASHKVLVHCFAGRSRSVAIILAYLMYKLRIPLSVALVHVRQLRSNANPNMGFINQLKAFEQELFSLKKLLTFDSLLSDLNSLIPGAKDRLKNLADGRGSLTPNEKPARSSSGKSSPSPTLRNPGKRCRSAEPVSTAFNCEPSEKDRRNREPSFHGMLSRWFMMILLVLFVVGFERVFFPHYSRIFCGSLKAHSQYMKRVCDRMPVNSTRAEDEIVRAVNRMIDGLIFYFPKI